MNKVYQNGDFLLGTKKDLKMYNDQLFSYKEIDEDVYYELENELKNYKDDTILLLNEGFGMGPYIREFEDVVWFEKEVL